MTDVMVTSLISSVCLVKKKNQRAEIYFWL